MEPKAKSISLLALMILLFAISPLIVNAEQAKTSVDIKSPIKAISIDFDNVYFGILVAGGSSYVFGDVSFTPPSDSKPTLNNSGEVNVSVQVTASDMRALGPSGEVLGTIPSGSLDVKIVPLATGNLGTPVVINGVEAKKLYAMDFDINVPSGIADGKYIGTVYVVAQ